MKNKCVRLLAAILAVMCCMAAFSVNAFASDGGGYYASDETGNAVPPASIDSITVTTEGVKLPENQGSSRLTPDGNMTLVDDILQDESYYVSEEYVVENKQFLTVQSKSGNTFYLVIDRSGDTENVYFLNLVDEADLLALMEGEEPIIPKCTCADKCVIGSIHTDCEVCRSNMSECMGKEKAPEKVPEPVEEPTTDKGKESGGNPALIAVVLLALIGGGALYWFKLRKPKTDTKGTVDLDDYDYGEDEEDTDYEFENEDADKSGEVEE